MPSTVELFKQNLNPVLVETGCYLGDGIQNALKAGFDTIISIEVSPYYYDKCRNRYKNNSDVSIVFGDSAKKLKDVVAEIDEPITYWLDGHFSGGNTGKGIVDFPIIEELKQIPYNPKNIIIIDDINALESVGIPRKVVENTIKDCFPNVKLYIL